VKKIFYLCGFFKAILIVINNLLAPTPIENWCGGEIAVKKQKPPLQKAEVLEKLALIF